MSNKSPLIMSAFDKYIIRDGKIFFSVDGITHSERKKLEIVLLALNPLNLSGPKARLALRGRTVNMA